METSGKPTYTRERAGRALPLIRAIASDLRETYLRLRDRLAGIRGGRSLDELVTDETLPEELRHDLRDVRDLLGELDELGATLHDPELGIVTVRGDHGGREVNYCWKLGETELGYWFPLGGAYEDRKPLDKPVLASQPGSGNASATGSPE